MEKIDMAALIQDALARFNRNRIGDKPPVSLIIITHIRRRALA